MFDLPDATVHSAVITYAIAGVGLADPAMARHADDHSS